MQLLKFRQNGEVVPRIGWLRDGEVHPLSVVTRISEVLHADDPADLIHELASPQAIEFEELEWLAPIDGQEVWAAGVTYERSKVAREEESEQAATFYDLVYKAERPELFFKATTTRIVGPDRPIRVRDDSRWSVPEPELTLVLSPSLKLVGFTVGNDVSARDIEGTNPLYLPQAKVYDACCALGPVVTLADGFGPDPVFPIRLTIERGGRMVFEGETSTSRMARRFDDLIAWLGRENVYPEGVYLMTGTGIVPPDDFTLEPGDVVAITIDGIGTLRNPVVRGGLRPS